MTRLDLRVAFNPNIVDKHEDGDLCLFRDGWMNAELVLDDVIKGQTEEGWAACAQMSGPRCKANFLAADIAFVDIDEASSIESVLDHPLVKGCAAYAYTTASHTPDAPRLRVAFILPRTITKADEYAAVTTALTLRLSGDLAATDAARISFGCRGAEVFPLDGEISEALLDELIQQGSAAASRAQGGRYNGSARSSIALDDDQMVRLASGVDRLLRKTPARTRLHCPYHDDRRPSAFVVESQKGIHGIHCSTCGQTFWPLGAPEFDFDSFDRAAIAAKARLDRHREDVAGGLFSHSHETYPGLTECGITIVEGAPAPPSLVDGVTMIKSPKGSGKTRALIRLLHDERSVLLIGHRRSLIRTSCKLLNLQCYLDESHGRSRHKRFGVSLDSLGRLPWDVRYDVLVLDESEQLFAHFLTDTMDRRGGSGPDHIFTLFRYRVQRAKKIVALDADLGWTTFETLRRMCNLSKDGQ